MSGDNVDASAGYSMLELLVVLAIMALLAVTAIPAALGSIERMTLAGDARRVTGELRRLREQAQDQQSEIIVTMRKQGGNTLSVSDGSVIALAWGTEATLQGVDKRDTRVVLSWDGSISGSVVLVRYGATTRISAESLTGRLVVERAQ
jgi:general secretion pathway protein H